MTIDPTRSDALLNRIAEWEPGRHEKPLTRDRLQTHGMTAPSAKNFETDVWSASKAIQTIGGLTVMREQSIWDLRRNHEWAEELNEDTDGFVTNANEIWLRPDAQFPIKTAAHELAHYLLKHNSMEALIRRTIDIGLRLASKVGKLPPPDVAKAMAKAADETEAETTALLVVDALGYPDASEKLTVRYSAGYCFQNMPVRHLSDRELVKRTAQTILSAGLVSAIRKAA